MGLVYPCAGSQALAPFLLENMDIRVYSVEELCHVLGEHTFLVDETMMSQALVDWLEKECSLTELAHMLKRLMDNGASFGLFFSRLLYYVGYQKADEIDRISRFLNSSEGMDPVERRKNIADYLASSGRLESALKQYQLLYYEIEDRAEDSIKGAIMHNMGYVNTRLFRFREACWLFRQAYDLNRERASLEQYIAAARLMYYMEDTKGTYGKERYKEFLAARGEDFHDIALTLERRMKTIMSELDESPQVKHLAEDIEQAGESEEAIISVLRDETERIRGGYSQMIRE